MKADWIKVKDQLPVVPEGKKLVDVLVVAKVHFVPDHVDQRDWTYVVAKATYEPEYGFYGNDIYNYNVKEWMYAPEMPKRYARYVWSEDAKELVLAYIKSKGKEDLTDTILRKEDSE